jgi:hypothetical protein
MIRIALTIVLLLVVVSQSIVLAAEPPELIIRNVQIIKPGERSKSTKVDIRIYKGRVALISEDRIHAEEGVRVEDAENGYLLGNLEVGLPPQFLIVVENPVENFDVLLDTPAHTTFAIKGDEIIKDELSESLEDAPPTQVMSQSMAQRRKPGILSHRKQQKN